MAGKKLDFIITSLKLNLKTAMEYRLSFLGQLIGMIINDIFWVIFWYIFFAKFSEVKGWNFKEIMLLFASMAYAFGLTSGLFANHMNISRLIEEGGLDFYLTLPKDPLINILSGRISFAALGDLVFAIVLFFLVEGFNLKGFIIFIIAGTLGSIIFINFSITVNSLTFFTSRGSSFSKLMIDAILCFGMYPINIFQGGARLLLYTILPAAFISSIPVSIVRDFDITRFIILISVAILSTIISRTVFFTGLRRYTSGNLISLRM